MSRKMHWAFWGLMAFLSAGVALYSYRYLAGIGLGGPGGGLGNPYAMPWLPLHAGGAATALLVGSLQFLPRLRSVKGAHKWLGRVYAAGCIVGGLAGLRLAFGSTAGPIAGLGFGTLALLWLFATTQAWRFARERRFDDHRRWMIRSFAMTFAAVTLRLYLPIAPMLGYDFVDGYRLTAWSSWIPNLIVAELWMRRRFAQRVTA
jgi:uncharacterized membrane protein